MLLSQWLQIDPNVNLDYLLLGYTVMWLCALLYLLSLAVKQRNLRRDVALMRRLLAEE
jgi:hypothetical protein